MALTCGGGNRGHHGAGAKRFRPTAGAAGAWSPPTPCGRAEPDLRPARL